MDIDTNAVEVTKLSLLLKCLEGETQASIQQPFALRNERVLPSLDDNIRSGNSLISLNFKIWNWISANQKRSNPSVGKRAFRMYSHRAALMW